MRENPLQDYFESNSGRLVHKWIHYFDIYHRHFQRFCGQSPAVIEFGVGHGGSLQMWKDYFGAGARIFGIDKDGRCQRLEEEGITIFIGDQADRGFLQDVAGRIGPIQIAIDDGGHQMTQQIATFEEIFPLVAEGGVYLVEDLHTSYRKRYGGGLRKEGTFIEYSKRLIDRLHGYHLGVGDSAVDEFTCSADSLTFYDSVLVIEKRSRRTPPFHLKTGQPSF